MKVWRLASGRYDPVSGEGARVVGGRWNSPGRRMIYTSESLALSVLEALVHITGAFPVDYHAFCLELPDRNAEQLDIVPLGPNWMHDPGLTRAIGDQWLDQERSLALLVPSAVIPGSTNVLLNPAHPDIRILRVIVREPFRFDPRG